VIINRINEYNVKMAGILKLKMAGTFKTNIKVNFTQE
jgi:hypothetical protein